MNTETDYKNELVQTLWDLFKEVHGVRPRGMGYEKYSVTDLAINACMDVGASYIGTAMRWLEEAYDMEWV